MIELVSNYAIKTDKTNISFSASSKARIKDKINNLPETKTLTYSA